MVRPAMVILAIVGVAMMAPSGAAAQRTIQLDEVECDGCELTVTRVATLGSINDEYGPADRPQKGIVRDSRGRFYVKGGFPVAHILVYDGQGDLLEVRGGPGDGPGEFLAIQQFVLLDGDSLGTLDRAHRRLTVMAPDGSVGRTLRLPVEATSIVRVDREVFVVAGHEYAPGTHVVYPDGTTQRLEGDIPVLPRHPSASQRRLAGGPGVVWAARPDRYELARWSLDGGMTLLIDRVVSWFPDRETEGAANPEEDPPAPYLIDLYLDDDGRLWTLLRVAGPDWESAREGGSSSRSDRFDAIVEVIDVERQRLLVSQRFPWIPEGFTNDGLIVSETEGAWGMLGLDVWEPVLTVR